MGAGNIDFSEEIHHYMIIETVHFGSPQQEQHKYLLRSERRGIESDGVGCRRNVVEQYADWEREDTQEEWTKDRYNLWTQRLQ